MVSMSQEKTYVGLSQPDQNMECVTPATNEMRVPHTRYEKLSISANNNEREEADKVSKEIEDDVETVKVEEGTTSLGAG